MTTKGPNTQPVQPEVTVREEDVVACGIKIAKALLGEGYTVNKAMEATRQVKLMLEARAQATPPSPAPSEPLAYMRRWAFEGTDVMAMKKKDRPRGWVFHEVTRGKVNEDDVPLFAAIAVLTVALLLPAAAHAASPTEVYPGNWHLYEIAEPIGGGAKIYTDVAPHLRFTRRASCEHLPDVLVDGNVGCPVGYSCGFACLEILQGGK